MFCTDASNARFAYGGVAFSLEESGACWFVSSDSRRVSLHNCQGRQVGGHVAGISGTVASLDGVKLMASSFPQDEDAIVRIHCGVSSVTVCSGDIRVKTPLMEGRFPDLVKHIKPPEEGDASLVVSAGDLIAGLRKALIMSGKESMAAKFSAFGDGSLVISTETAEVGESEVTVFCEGNGKDSWVLANAAYMTQWLSTIASDDLVRLTIPFTEGGKCVKAIQLSADVGSFYLMSPMNFQ